jgi:adenylate cyclase
MDAQVTRRLAAILAADVAGFSRLMGADDEGTLVRLTASRALIADAVGEYHGRVVDTAGDSLLAEFGSVLDAVQSAIRIQRLLAQRNQALPEAERMAFRIGVNLGDVLVKDGGIFGDGVNVAARLQALGEPGGICISGSVFEQIDGRLDVACESLGEQTVKNIVRPVRAYRLNLGEGFAIAGPPVRSAAGVAQPGPAVMDGRPSIAVLPFENMSGDPEQEYFADGLTEDLITDLAALSQLRVLARNSTLQYKGQSVRVPELGKALGISHVVEGSVRKAGKRVRMTAQLIAVADGSHLWAERFDRDITDLFAVQDEIVQAIVTELHVKLLDGEQARSWRMSTTNPQAYDLFLRTMSPRQHVLTRRDYAAPIQYGEQAVALDPRFAYAHARLATLYRQQAWLGNSEERKAGLKRSQQAAERALAIDPEQPMATANLAVLYCARGQVEEGDELARRALSFDPTGSETLGMVAMAYVFQGKARQAFDLLEQAMRFLPEIPSYLYYLNCVSLFVLGRFEEAIVNLEEGRRRGWDGFFMYAYLAACHAALGREEQAHAAAQAVLTREPAFRAGPFAKSQGSQRPDDMERLTERLKQAGLPA